MTPGSIIPEILFYIALSALALVLCIAWLVYAARGRRALKISFKGFGMSISINSSARDELPTDLEG